MSEENIIVKCSRCHTKNRVPAKRIADHPVCGKCGAPLPGTSSQGRVVEVTDRSFGDEVLSSGGRYRRYDDEVVVPGQRCCGMPSFDIGDTQAIQQAARANVASLHPWVAQGYDVVVPTASCSLMLKREYLELNSDEKTKQVAERTFDVCEYLMRMKKDGQLVSDFPHKPGRVIAIS